VGLAGAVLRAAYDLLCLILVHAIHGDGYAILLTIVAAMIVAWLVFLWYVIIRLTLDAIRSALAKKAKRYSPRGF
jgi:hypothetical protein